MGLIINPYRFAAGGGGGGSWTPASLGSTLKGWYDADQQSEAADANVTSFVDRSGNGFHYNQDAAVAVPVLRYAVVNGKKALEAGNALNERRLQASSSLLNGATAGTMMMVVKGAADPSTSNNTQGVCQGFTTAGSPLCHFFTDGNIYESFGSTTRRNVNPTPSWASWRIYGAHSGTNDWAMWYDGTAIITSGTNTVSFGTGVRNMLWIGPGTDHFSGHLAELVLCDTVLSTSDRQKLEGYYAHKYALTANLPGGHPYISSPP